MTYYITETATYTVEADSEEAALDKFLEGPLDEFPMSIEEREIEADAYELAMAEETTQS